MTDDELAGQRRALLVPATFGVHSKIEGDLRDYIGRTFGHSTFASYEAFLDRPAKWWEKFEDVKAAETGTTEPFLSRFVHKSGLTPRVSGPVLQGIWTEIEKHLGADVVVPLDNLLANGIRDGKIDAIKTQADGIAKKIEILKKIRGNERPLKRIEGHISRLAKRLLELPLVATKSEPYHKDLEKLEFSLNSSIILRGLLQVWLAIEQGGKIEVGDPTAVSIGDQHPVPVEGWDQGVFDGKPLDVKTPRAGSTSCVSVIGRLDPDKIKKFYATAVLDYLHKWSLCKEDSLIRKALDLLREYQIALRPWIEVADSKVSNDKPIWIGASISSDAIL